MNSLFFSDFDGAVNRFPRFVLINADDHLHAAFYPRLMLEKESLAEISDPDMEGLQEFIDQYLLDPSEMLIQTEHF